MKEWHSTPKLKMSLMSYTCSAPQKATVPAILSGHLPTSGPWPPGSQTASRPCPYPMEQSLGRHAALHPLHSLILCVHDEKRVHTTADVH